MTVRIIPDGGGDPVVFGTGGPVHGVRFITATTGNYYIAGTSLCARGYPVELREQENAG